MKSYLRLFHLYNSRGLAQPLEDFTTEAFAGILTQYPEVLEGFCNAFLRVEGNGFQVKTQVYYPHDHIGCRVDLVIENNQSILFIENKVESGEGFVQLERYADALEKYGTGRSAFLFYCTKYHDPKEISRHQFRQFLWRDVAKFLHTMFPLPHIVDFVEFLSYYGMNSDSNFNVNEIAAMNSLTPLVKKMCDYLDDIRIIFSRYFSKAGEQDLGLQIRRHARLTFLKFLISSGGNAEIGVGFSFDPEPHCVVWIWAPSNVKYYPQLNIAIQQSSVPFDQRGSGIAVFTLPLRMVLNEKDMRKALLDWYEKRFEYVKQFVEANNQFGWTY